MERLSDYKETTEEKDEVERLDETTEEEEEEGEEDVNKGNLPWTVAGWLSLTRGGKITDIYTLSQHELVSCVWLVSEVETFQTGPGKLFNVYEAG